MEMRIDAKRVLEVLNNLKATPEQIKTIQKATVYRVTKMARTDIVRDTKEKYTVSAKDLRKSLKITLDVDSSGFWCHLALLRCSKPNHCGINAVDSFGLPVTP